MTKLLKYTLLTFLLSFAACSSEDDTASTVPNGQPQPGDALELTVCAADFMKDGAPDTRATDNDNTTTFEEGDRVGIIILDASNKPIYDNIPYKYDSSNNTWGFDSSDHKGGCYYDPESTTYIVYYPYSRAADGVKGVDDLKDRFAPKFNQSDIKDYRSSDLMVWDRTGHLASSVTTLDAELKHAFASIYLTPTAYRLDDGKDTKCNIMVSDVSLTIGDNVYVPYQAADGSLRCIVPAYITPSGIRCFYTFNGTTYGNKINISAPVAANTRYTSAPEIISKTYTLDDAKVGDFYCKNSKNEGYLIPGDVALTNDQKNACVGIVF
uniref:fimbrillin family protein n=1 Tax=uncultured Bacteroides sp. TaxID=162156 RepID=UPI0025CE3D9D